MSWVEASVAAGYRLCRSTTADYHYSSPLCFILFHAAFIFFHYILSLLILAVHGPVASHKWRSRLIWEFVSSFITERGRELRGRV